MSRMADSLPKKPRHLKRQSEEIKDKARDRRSVAVRSSTVVAT